MRHIYNFFSSVILMAVLFLVIITGMAYATFVENDFGTEAARILFYNAKWFELIFVIAIINIIMVVIRYRLYKKPAIFLFHISFIIIIAGAGITRYFGFEGSMHIREKGKTARVLTEKSYINFKLDNVFDLVTSSKEVALSAVSKPDVTDKLTIGNETFEFSVDEFIPHAVPTVKETKNGIPVVELVVASNRGREVVVINQYKQKEVGNLVFHLQDSYFKEHFEKSVWLRMEEDSTFFWAPFDVMRKNMMTGEDTVLGAKKLHPFIPMQLYDFKGNQIVLSKYYQSGMFDAEATDNNELPDAVKVKIRHEDIETFLIVYGRKGEIGNVSSVKIHDVVVFINYGANIVKLPFSLKLNDFIIKRYPGSNSPSWYESNIQLIDEKKGVNRTHRIYMNHILKYRGFKFYQSSYDSDEKGTILSINYDMFGSTVTYIGYLFMGLGMLLSLFSKRSRFRKLLSMPTVTKLIIFFLFIILPQTNVFSQSKEERIPDSLIIRKEHADRFGQLAIQDINGRIKPLNTIASEVLRKIARKESYKGLSANQVFLGIMVHPDYWKGQPLIKVGHPSINLLVGKKGKYLSFNDFFSDSAGSNYLIYSAVNEAHRKKPAYRSKADNEVIRLDERLRVFDMVATTRLLKIFPHREDMTDMWYSPVTAVNQFEGEDSSFVEYGITYYNTVIRQACISGNWNEADDILGVIKKYQVENGGELIPSNSKLSFEIFYNKVNLFNRIGSYYLFFGLILFVIQLISLFSNRKLKIPLLVLSIPVYVLFGLHVSGLILRWYISGHAPWSNGYEALVFIGWVLTLAGIIFSRRYMLTLSLSAILTSLILTTAHLSWMDPQVTNLVPVLKSYWLIIHVAVITGSYAFLALGAILSVLNLFFMFFESARNTDRIRANIKILSNTVELTLTIGLYMLTIGTFLGGIWANESWGRYWGWDPKETWSLISVIAYAFILHLRLLPIKNYIEVIFNSAAVFGFFFVIMTYFGVNYYLSGLHSYAAGDPLPVPMFVYFVLPSWAIITALAFIVQYQLKKSRN